MNSIIYEQNQAVAGCISAAEAAGRRATLNPWSRFSDPRA
jgi:hypothetical protein